MLSDDDGAGDDMMGGAGGAGSERASCTLVLQGHTAMINAVAFVPAPTPSSDAGMGDNNGVGAAFGGGGGGCELGVSASDDATVRVWDLLSGACRHVLTEHDNSVLCLACITLVAPSPSQSSPATPRRGGAVVAAR